MSGLFDRDLARQAQPWRAPVLGATGAEKPQPVIDSASADEREGARGDSPGSSSVATEPVLLPTAAELEAVFDEARREGYDEGHTQGYEDGRRAGYAEGLSVARAQAEEEVRRLGQMLTALQGPVDRLADTLESAVVALAIEIARQVVMNEIRTEPARLLDLLRRALVAFPIRAGTPVVRVHPDDAAMLRELAPDLESSGVVVSEDPALERGDLVVLAGSGSDERINPNRRWRARSQEPVSELDLRLEERWRQAMAKLFEEGAL